MDVGGKLVEELFTMPAGLSPQLEAALEAFAEDKKKREAKIKELTEKADKGGVKGMAAKQELRILESGDTTEMNRIELTLAAANRAATKTGAFEVGLTPRLGPAYSADGVVAAGTWIFPGRVAATPRLGSGQSVDGVVATPGPGQSADGVAATPRLGPG